MTSWQKFLRPLYVWLLHLSGFDKRFADRSKKYRYKLVVTFQELTLSVWQGQHEARA